MCFWKSFYMRASLADILCAAKPAALPLSAAINSDFIDMLAAYIKTMS